MHLALQNLIRVAVLESGRVYFEQRQPCHCHWLFLGAPVAQYVKRWSAYLEDAGWRPVRGRDLFNRRQGFFADSLSLTPTNLPNMTKILLKRS